MTKDAPANDSKTLIGAIDKDVLKFTVGQDPVLDRELVEWDCIGSAAHVTMLSKISVNPTLFTKDDRDAVVAELVEIMRRGRLGEFDITAEDQDVHLAVERNLTEKLGDLGKKIHTGRSRNDQVAVDLRLHAREHLLGVILETCELAKQLIAFGKKHRKVPMVGRTHLQPAMPSSVGLWATGWAEGFLDDVPTVEAAFTYADRCPLGSAAGYGVPLPLDREMTSKLLGFAAPHHNVFHASNTRGKCEAVILSSLAQLMITASRMAEDLILFSMPEFGYFTLPRDMCTGSSIMPQKYNPDVLELIRAKASQVIGLQTAACGIVTAMPGGYNRDLQDTKALYMEGLSTTRSTLRILKLMISGLQVNVDRLRAGFSPSVFATDRALELVAGGMPFRVAYKQIREHLEDLTAADPDAALNAKTLLGGTAGLDFAALNDRAVDYAKNATARRKSIYAAFSKLLGAKYPELI